MEKKYFLSDLVICSLLASSQLAALPPPVPSAGVVERQLEKEYEGKPIEPRRELPAVQIDIPKEKLEISEGANVLVEHIAIQGNDSIASQEIYCQIRKYLGRELSMREIYDLCHTIDQYYAYKGYFLARAYPPPQAIENHTLLIEVIEGKLGNIEIVGNQFYSEKFIRGYFTSLQGKPLCYDDFLRALMLLNDNSDLTAGAVFEKGKEFGCADVIVRVDDTRPVHLYLNGNNYGRNLTTNSRIGGRFDVGNVIAYGDQLSIAEVIGFPVDALYFTDVVYTVPLNKSGTSLSGSYLFSKFNVEEKKIFHQSGRSDIGTLKVNHALIRRRSLDVDLFSYFDYKQIQNFVYDYRTSFDKLRVLTIGALVDHFSPSQGRDYLTLQFAVGIPDFLGGLNAVDNHSSRKGAGGRFFVLTADYDRLQPLPRDCYFYFHGSGQLSPGKLTVPEQIYIGGVDTVRGFPLAVALGDNGYYLNFEFRIPPPFLADMCFAKTGKKWKEILQLDAFLDHGGVLRYSESSTFLWGSGCGIRVNGPCNFALSFDVGFPLNHKDYDAGFFYYLKVTCQAF